MKKKTFKIEDLKFDAKGLIPAIIQDYRTGDVLMMAYMNKASLYPANASSEYPRYKPYLQTIGNRTKNSI